MSQTFRFHSIYQLRERQRDAAATSVEEVQRAIQIVDNQLEELRREIGLLDGQRKLALQGQVSVNSLMEIQRHQLMLLGNVQFLNQQRGKLMQEKTRRDHALLKAQQALKSIDKLREQHIQADQARDASLLQARLDEWANTRSILESNIPRHSHMSGSHEGLS